MDKIVLMYHCVYKENLTESGFLNPSAFQYKIPLSKFEEQVSFLSQKDNVWFTFDDGGISFYTIIAPILEKYHKRGIFFIATQYIGTPGFLSIEQIKELDANGHVIASHSHTHPLNFASLSYKDMLTEWKKSTQILERIVGHEIQLASIPNGYYSSDVYKSASECGITELYTSKPTTAEFIKSNINIIGRYVVHNAVSFKTLCDIVNYKSVRMKVLLRYQIIEMVKRILGDNYNKLKVKLLNK